MVVLFLEEDFSKGEGSRGNLGGYFGKVEVEEFMRVLSWVGKEEVRYKYFGV